MSAHAGLIGSLSCISGFPVIRCSGKLAISCCLEVRLSLEMDSIMSTLTSSAVVACVWKAASCDLRKKSLTLRLRSLYALSAMSVFSLNGSLGFCSCQFLNCCSAL